MGFFDFLSFLNFFRKTSSESAPVGYTEVREALLTTLSEMVPVLVRGLEGQFPVQVLLNNATVPFASQLEWEWAGEANKKRRVKTHIEKGEYLLLAALVPPVGNLKIRSAREVTLEFTTQSHLINCTTTLDQITPTRQIRLAFPSGVIQRRERRGSFRALVDLHMPVTATVVRASGIAFDAKFRNVSASGFGFFATGAIPKVADNSKVEMSITHPDGKVEVGGVILGSYPSSGEQVFRAQFLPDGDKEASSVSALVAYVQREHMLRRQQMQS